MQKIFTDILSLFFKNNLWLLVIISFAISFLIIPLVILLSKKLKIGDKGGGRKIHKKYIPNLGGIAILISFLLSMIIWAPNFRISIDLKQNEFIYGGISILLLFIVGVRDDILPMRSSVKLIAQILVAFIVVILGKLYINDFDGFLGFENVPIFYSQLLSVVIIIAIINAYNLIDGIDGLAASLTIVSLLFFGIWFLLGNNLVMFAISFSLIGALLGFLWYNISPAKIFMGDTGSMFLGFIVAILAVRFIDFNAEVSNKFFYVDNAPLIAMTAMLIPLADVGRVFIDRILDGNSPFKADKNHIHHLLLKLGFSHNMVVTLLVFLAFTFVFVSLALNNHSVIVFFVFLLLFIGFSIVLKYLIKGKIKKIRNS